MRDLLETLDAWRAEGVDAGRAVVVRTFGSAPRPEGAVLLVADDGRLMGSVSGGRVEGAPAEEIERARRTRNARGIRYGHSAEEAWDFGLACGGGEALLGSPPVAGGVPRGAPRRPGARAVGRRPQGGRPPTVSDVRGRGRMGPGAPGRGAAAAAGPRARGWRRRGG